jgi:hypothetical protein
MAPRENIRLSKPNFTTDGSFFYFIHETAQVLYAKVDDGSQSFTYPLDTTPSQPIKSLEWDGVFFWSLEDHITTVTVDGFVIRKWVLDDFICKQISVYTFVDSATHTYRSSSFAVEHYRTSIGLGNNDGGGNGYLGVNLLDEVYLYDTSKIAVGELLYFVKRWTPTHVRYGTANIEQVLVNSIISSTKVGLSSNTVGDPYSDLRGWRGQEANPSASEPLPPDEVYWTKYIWVFNLYSPGPTSTPALYKINAYNGSLISQDSGTQYGSVNASTFYVKYNTDSKTDPDHTESLTFNTSIVDDASSGGKQTYVVYIKSSSGLFYNSTTGATDRSLLVDNVKVDTVTLWEVYDMAVMGTEPDVTLLRLQLGTTYKNTGGTLIDETWSSVYSYDRSLLRRHAKSIAVTATPSIVPITTGNAAIVATVRDQYNSSIPAGVQVSFTDDDSGTGTASLSPTTATTDAFGRAYTTFYAGSTEKDVKVTATSTWVSTT